MKQQNIIQRLSLFLLVLVLAVPALAQKERGGGSTFSIGSAADWKTFCDRVNGGETTLNAKLTANIELNADADLGQEIVIVNNLFHPYSGTFDGQGHMLTINWNVNSDEPAVLFEDVGNTTIKNLHVKGEIKSKGGDLTGLINEVHGTTTISGCIIEVNLKAKSRLAGMVCWVGADAKLTITDCIVKGDFTATSEKGVISGFVCRQYGNCTLNNCLYLGTNNANNNESYTFAGDNTEVKNCYYLNACGKAQGDKITEAQLRSGEVAYMLQARRNQMVWGQTIGTDAQPQFTTDATKRVYEVKFTYNGKEVATRYANKDGKVILPTTKDIVGESYNPHHYYALTFGGGFSASTTITEDRQVAVTLDHKEYYEIKNKDDWKAFCDIVESGQTSVDAKLTQDVDLGSEIVMAGTEDPNPFGYDDFLYYTGTFDGQGHTLKFNWNAGKDDRIAPFKYVKDATIKNLRTQGKITKKGYGLSGMVYIALGTTTISGCISDVDITGGDGSWNDSQAAGMVQAVGYQASVHITDCLVKGSITDNADESYKAMAGFVMSNSGTYTLTRCLYVGKNNATNDKYSKTFGTETGYGATFTDCYYLNPCGKAQGTQVTAERLKSGEMAKLLQGDRTENVWGQTLGTDLEPLPTADATKRVYQVKFTYNSEVKATRYATNGQSIHGGLPTFTAKDLLGTGYNPHHYYAIAFADGFNASTTVTADRQVTVSITEKDCYEIASKADWQAFCALVEDGQTAVDAKMTKDVDLETDITMAGTANKPYAGTFDGQNHTLTVNWDAGSAKDVAPFGRVNGATIKNLRTEGSIRSDGYYLGGLIDEAYGGSNTVANCVSAVNITSSHTSDRCGAGGLISYIFPSARVTITDCLVKGSIDATTEKGQKGMGGFVYSQNGTCTLTRCLYAGTNNADNSNNNCYTFAPTNTSGATTTLNNCHYLNPCGEAQGEQVTKEQLKNGYVAHKLQGTREETVWGQVLGTDTIPQPTAEVAKQVYEVKFTLNGKVKAMRYANRGGHVSLPTVQELLGEAYDARKTYTLAFGGGFSDATAIDGNHTVAATVAVSCFNIATKDDWRAFGDLVRSGEGNLNAKLTADLNLGTEILKIGSESTSYSGTFDGQGHTVTVDWNGNGGGYFALFPFVTDATIKNLRVTGQMTSDSEPLSVFALEARGTTTFSGCVSDVKITNGDKNDTYCAAGMVRAAYSKGKITFKDCIVAGDLNGTTDNSRQGMGGFVCGQADDATCTFDNCLYTGTNNSKGGYTFAPNPTLNNCYYLNPCGTAQGDKITEAQQKSGYVAHKLQGDRTDNVWGQTLGTDLEPLPTTDATKRVYEVKFTYDTYEKTSRYANNGQGIHGTLPTAEELLGAGYNPKLTYALNFGNFTATTPVTADKTVDVGVDVSGTFPIATKDDWKEFCGVVNNGVTAVDAKLTADVNLGTEVVWVGDNYNQYGGTFDGQGHTLSFDWTSQGDPAPFDFVDGATIKNLRTKGKITTSGGEASGLLGNAYGATTISNCVSDVEITSSIDWDACEAAGLVQTVGYNGKVTVTDCVVKGRITATTEKGRKGMAGFVYTLDDGGACTLTNCLYLGKNNGVGDECFTFAPAGITLNNCYYLNACGKAQGDKITEAQLKNGYVAHKLQGDRTDNVWGQTLGTDDEPMLTTEKAKHVYKVDFKYMDEVKATRYANSGGRVKLPTAKELLGADYDAQKSYTLTFENGFSETTAINGDITVSVTVNVVTGIDGVTDDNSTVRGAVYNLQGVRVAESSDAETLRRLPAGVYIVKGKKFVVR